MDVTKPCKSKGFGDMVVTKPYKSKRFGAMDVTKPYDFIGFGAMAAAPHRKRGGVRGGSPWGAEAPKDSDPSPVSDRGEPRMHTTSSNSIL